MAGQIINRGGGAWLLRVFLGSDPASGKRIYYNETYHGNKQAAVRKSNELLAARDNGKLTIGSNSNLVGDLLDDVIRDYEINGKDAEWVKGVVKRIRPTLGAIPLSKIRTAHVDSYVARAKAEGYLNATINRDLAILRRAFNLARKKGTIGTVQIQIPRLQENNVRKGFFEHAEYTRLRDALPVEVRPILTFAFYTGCRKGEILGLRWSQVDLIRRVIRLEAGETKSGEGRIIPLHVEELYQTLAMLRAERDQDFPECPWVFTRRGTRVLNFRKSWDAACEAAGLWDATRKRPTRILHDCRRSGVRNLVRAGVPEKIVMSISGHKTRSVFDRYNIVSEGDLIDAMKRLDVYTRERQAAEENVRSESWHTRGTQRPNRVV